MLHVVSRTTTVTYGDRGFWALDDAFGVWMGYIVEEIDHEHGDDPWLDEMARHWRVAAAITELGARVSRGTRDQVTRLIDVASGARERACSRGTLTVDQLRRWVIVDDLSVSQGFSRTGNHVEIERVLEVADAFIALLDGSLPPDPYKGASSPVGIDSDRRERLVFIDGDVAVPPYPSWSQSDTALASISVLLRALHDASRRFDPRGLTWSEELADPAGGPIVCHNDVCLENVVFREGSAVGLLDFDFAAPGRPVYDIAQFARMCVPIDDETSTARLGWQPADRPGRLRLIADSYGLEGLERVQLIAGIGDSITAGGAFVRRRVEARDPNFITMWNQMGGQERFDRRSRWWAGRRQEFASTLG
jgi:hypothetical protein